MIGYLRLPNALLSADTGNFSIDLCINFVAMCLQPRGFLGRPEGRKC